MISSFAENLIEFKDIKGHWAEEAIQTLANKDIIHGKGNNIFDPQGTVTVAEFITLSLNVMGEKVPVATENEKWFSPYIKKAIELNIIENQQFSSYNRPIKREEMSSIAINTYGRIHSLGSSLVTGDVISKIKDYHKINDRYKDSVLNSYLVGLFNGRPGDIFDPKGTATRAEAAIVTLKMIDKTKLTPVTFDDIPYVETTTLVYDETTGDYIDEPVILYAPMGLNGKRETDVIDLYKFAMKYKETSKYDSSYGYSVAKELVGIGAANVTKEQYNQLSILQKVDAENFSFEARLNKFNKNGRYDFPYEIIFFHINNEQNYMENFKNQHNELWSYMLKIIFADDYQKVDQLVTQAIKTVSINGKVELRPISKFNGRKIEINGDRAGLGIDIYNKQ